MVEQIRISPEEVRGYGNVCEEHSLEDFIVSSSGLAKEKETVHGALTDVYKLVYSLYGLMFDFDNGNKQLYLQMGEEDLLSFGFDDDSKQLYLLDMAGTGLSLGFDEDTDELYITDDAPPIVHNYSLALDQSSYTTSGSLSVSATLLDDGVAVEGATVSFTGGVSTVTATTNSSGVATATVTFSASGTLTATYSNVSDTASVTVGQATLSLATNKSILSYYDSDSATLTATYPTGATMELYNADTMTKIGNFTENSGTYTYTYSANGTGDINLVAKVGSTTSDPVTIEDCLFYGINTNAFTIPSNTTFTSDGTKITATTNTSGEKLVYFNHNFSSSDDFLYEAEIAQLGVTQYCGLAWNDVTYYGGHQANQNKAYVHLNTDTEIAHTWAVGDTYTVIKQNGTTTAYVNDDMIDTTTASYQSSFKLGFFINRNRTQYYKNIKIKILE